MNTDFTDADQSLNARITKSWISKLKKRGILLEEETEDRNKLIQRDQCLRQAMVNVEIRLRLSALVDELVSLGYQGEGLSEPLVVKALNGLNVTRVRDVENVKRELRSFIRSDITFPESP